MENLIKRLKNELDLSEGQAIAAVTIVKEYMDNEGITVNWEQFFKGKYAEYVNQSKQFLNTFSKKMDNLKDKVSDKVEDVTLDAKRKVRDASKTIYDKLNEDEK